VPSVHDDDVDPDDELGALIGQEELEAAEEEMSAEDFNAHLLEIRRADGTELISFSTVASGEPWTVHMQPGGSVQNAYAGPKDRPHVWVNTDELQISRDESGTYFICVD
jgi:hypothetical protein